MPGSQIVPIYEALAAMPVTALGWPTTRVWHPFDDSIKWKVEPGECPVRILLPGGSRQQRGTWQFVKQGKTSQTSWLIDDMLLLTPLGLGKQGPNSIPRSLLLYEAAYLDALAQLRAPTSQSWIVRAEHDAGQINYPDGSESWFYGIAFTVIIEEVCSNVS